MVVAEADLRHRVVSALPPRGPHGERVAEPDAAGGVAERHGLSTQAVDVLGHLQWPVLTGIAVARVELDPQDLAPQRSRRVPPRRRVEAAEHLRDAVGRGEPCTVAAPILVRDVELNLQRVVGVADVEPRARLQRRRRWPAPGRGDVVYLREPTELAHRRRPFHDPSR